MLRTAQSLPHKGFRHWASTRPVSRPSRQSATGPPDSYPDRTHTGKRRRAYKQRSTTYMVNLHSAGRTNNAQKSSAVQLFPLRMHPTQRNNRLCPPRTKDGPGSARRRTGRCSSAASIPRKHVGPGTLAAKQIAPVPIPFGRKSALQTSRFRQIQRFGHRRSLAGGMVAQQGHRSSRTEYLARCSPLVAEYVHITSLPKIWILHDRAIRQRTGHDTPWINMTRVCYFALMAEHVVGA